MKTPTVSKEQRLPKVNYKFVKEPYLRQKLREFGLRTDGNRAQLEKRYTEWVTMHNANLDSSYPKAKRELIRDLERWEKEELKSILAETKNPFKQSDFSGEKWAAQNRPLFEDLIAKATAGHKRRKVEVKPEEGGVEAMDTQMATYSDCDETEITSRKTPSIQAAPSPSEPMLTPS